MKNLMKGILTLAVVGMFTIVPTKKANAAFLMGGVSRYMMDDSADNNPMWEKINKYSMPTFLGAAILGAIIGGPPTALIVIAVLDKESDNLEAVSKLKTEFKFLNNIDGLAEAIVDTATEKAMTQKPQKGVDGSDFLIITINNDEFYTILEGFDVDGYDQEVSELASVLN